MKDRALIFLSLFLSIAALLYAAWVQRHAEAMAQQALKKRERELVQKIKPQIQRMYTGLGVTNTVGNATTLDELFGPYLNVMNKIGESDEDSSTNSHKQR